MRPLVTIVMGVYNDAEGAEFAAESILNQTYRDIEIIIVDDGSTDGCGSRLDRMQRLDKRLWVLRNRCNLGLTRSLIRGCSHARGKYIARQDAGDWSREDRIEQQVEMFQRQADAVLVGCHNEFVERHGEVLYTMTYAEEDITPHLLSTEESEIQSPVHASVMFRRDIYEAVGGYDANLPVAQDFDLWLRMVRRGSAYVVRESLYKVQVRESSISSYYRDQQRVLKSMLLDLYNRKGGEVSRNGMSNRIRMNMTESIFVRRMRKSDTAYFIARCLSSRNAALAKYYYWRAIRFNPVNVRAWLRLIGGGGNDV